MKTHTTYTVAGVRCLNCGWNEDAHGRGKDAEIPVGVSVPAHRCPVCGCDKLWKDRR